MTTAKHTFAFTALVVAFSCLGCGGSGAEAPRNGEDTLGASEQESRGTQKVTIRTTEPEYVVLFQDGDGPWVQLTAVGTQLFRGVVKDPAGRYGIATVIPFDTQADIYHLTTAESTTVDLRRGPVHTQRSIKGNILGFNSATHHLTLSCGGVGQQFFQTPYDFNARVPGDFFAQTYAKSETASSTDALGSAKYMIRRGITGNTRINLNLAGPEFLPMQEYSLDTSGMAEQPTGFSVGLKLGGRGAANLLQQSTPSTRKFLAPAPNQLGPTDGFFVAFVNYVGPSYRNLAYAVNQPTETVPMMDFSPNLTATVASDPSGWKVSFTSDPAYDAYNFFVSGARGVKVALSRGWVQANNATSFSNPTQVGTFQPFKKAFAGVKNHMSFYAVNSGDPIVEAMMYPGRLPRTETLPTSAGAHLLSQTFTTSMRF